MSQTKTATLYGVGVGPGDPELITRKAERILRQVDWIFLPAGGQDGISFVRRIVEPLGLPDRKFRTVPLHMSRDRTVDLDAYEHAALEIVAELHQGKSVAWIAEGDPLFYSTFAHLLESMRRYPDVQIEIIPGIPSTNAAAARVGWPSARLAERMAVVPAAYGIQNLEGLLDEFATVFLLKVNNVFDELLGVLRNQSGPIRAVYLEHIGTPVERVVTDLESLRGQELPYFSLIMIQREKRN